MNKHTKGPWILDSDERTILKVDGEDKLFTIPGQNVSKEEADANAHLIAAAPELLECLKAFVNNERLINDDHFSGVQERLIALCRKTIAKAEGQKE